MAYLRRAMVNQHTSLWRRIRRELLSAQPPETGVGDQTSRLADRTTRDGRVLPGGGVPQLSPISVTTVRRRSAVAVSDGITPLWTTNDRKASVIDQAPWARIDRMDWRQYLEPNYEMPVRGGVRGRATVRCTPGTVCNDKKLGKPCSGWNSYWEPRQLARFDDLIAGAAATELKPVKHQMSRKRTHWFWETAKDLAEVDMPEAEAMGMLR